MALQLAKALSQVAQAIALRKLVTRVGIDCESTAIVAQNQG
jgi:hypothetical protein